MHAFLAGTVGMPLLVVPETQELLCAEQQKMDCTAYFRVMCLSVRDRPLRLPLERARAGIAGNLSSSCIRRSDNGLNKLYENSL